MELGFHVPGKHDVAESHDQNKTELPRNSLEPRRDSAQFSLDGWGPSLSARPSSKHLPRETLIFSGSATRATSGTAMQKAAVSKARVDDAKAPPA